MFSFREGIAEELSFRLIPEAGSISDVVDSAEDDSIDDGGSESMARALPSKDVTEATLTSAYEAFILYCNPQFPAEIDTSILVEKFNSVPRTDQKDFKTWDLFNLIKQFDAKEIDTWGQLALELGVEPPDTSKMQSIQKVQQYTVRLKRWMRAMHIDAFFEYLMGKQHVYFTNVPTTDDPYPREGRDGVPKEEDLALRALEPSLRPKRGRRRNSDTETIDEVKEASRMSGTITFEPHSAYPQSAHPSTALNPWAGASGLPQGYNTWQPQSAIDSSSNYRWGQDMIPRGEAISTPMSALPGPSMSFEDAYANEPMSAITPSSKKRRKHGPAVSSAWSSATPTGSRPRGRPPASRLLQDGPYTTFPVSQSETERSATASSPPQQASVESMPPPRATPIATRPLGLSLQVPQHTGRPIRLATPPRLIVSREASRATSEPGMEVPVLAFETMKRTLASDLLRADMIGRPTQLTGDEAKRLADAVLDKLGVARTDEDIPSNRTYLARLTAASWLGLGDQLNIPAGPAMGQQKKLRITRLRTDAEGYEEIVPADEETGELVRQVFDIRWQASQGSCQGNFEVAGLTIAPAVKKSSDVADIHDFITRKVISEAKDAGLGNEVEYLGDRAKQSWQKYGHGIRASVGTDGAEDEIDWKAKTRMLEFGASLAHGEFDRYKATMLQKVLDIFLQ